MQTLSAEPNSNLEIKDKDGQKERQDIHGHFTCFAQTRLRIVTLLAEI
jgi:hypothetical protein